MTILELREKRNTAWNAAKAFLDSHRTEKVLSLQRTMRLIPEWNRKSQISARKSLVWRGRKHWMLSLASR